MILKHTHLSIVDNSGAGQVQCIHVQARGQNRAPGQVGSLLLASVKRLRRSIPKKKVGRGEVVAVLVVAAAHPLRRRAGLVLRYRANLGILLSRERDRPLASRVVLPVFAELRGGAFGRLLTLSPRVL